MTTKKPRSALSIIPALVRRAYTTALSIVRQESGPPNLQCPYCRLPMDDVSRTGQGEPTHSVYQCKQFVTCAETPIYRRVDINWEVEDAQEEARRQAVAQSLASFYTQNEQMNQVTLWIRSHRPDLFGSSKTWPDMVIEAMSKPKPSPQPNTKESR